MFVGTGHWLIDISFHYSSIDLPALVRNEVSKRKSFLCTVVERTFVVENLPPLMPHTHITPKRVCGHFRYGNFRAPRTTLLSGVLVGG